MMLFLGQEPQQINFYIITVRICSWLSCIINNSSKLILLLILRKSMCGQVVQHPCFRYISTYFWRSYEETST